MGYDCKLDDKCKRETTRQQNVSKEDIFHLGAKVIIKNRDNKILVLRCENKTETYWDLPGGRIHVGCTLEETAVREVIEETGITNLENLHFLEMVPPTIRVTLADGQNVGIIFAFFEATVDDAVITLSDEHQGYEWVTADEATKRVSCMGASSLLEE